jgi:hypothetical protein
VALNQGLDDVVKVVDDGIKRIPDKDKEALKEKYTPSTKVKDAINSPEVNVGAAVAGEPTQGAVKSTQDAVNSASHS